MIVCDVKLVAPIGSPESWQTRRWLGRFYHAAGITKKFSLDFFLHTMSPTAITKRKRDESTEAAELKKQKKLKKEKKDKKDKKDKKEKKSKKEKKQHDHSQPEKAIEQQQQPLNNNDDVSFDQLAKYTYKEHAELTSLPESTITDYLKKNEVDIQGDLKLRPILQFAYTNVPNKLLKVFENFSNPTPIQATTWPFTLSGRDIVGIAETGSGKTYGFTLPGLVHLASNKSKSKNPSMLVLSPTRELAMQSEEQAREAGKMFGLKTICLYGGVDKASQARRLATGTDIVVATPGRLLDLLNDEAIDLSEVSFLVLDEADRMLDEGFERDIRAIIGHVPKQRQTLMFSATWPMSIRKLAADFLNNPIRVTIGSPDLAASNSITQIVEVVDDPRSKEGKLLQLLKKIHGSRKNRVLVFGLYKKECDRIERRLIENGYKVAAIHGSKKQHERNEALANFKSATHPLMIATDVAARGLDIPDVEYVVNLTFPLTIESYIHRIGRTGRGGKKGTAYTFFTPEDKAHSGELINVLKQANMPVPDELYKFGTTVKKKTHSAYGAFFKDTSEAPKATKIVFGDD